MDGIWHTDIEKWKIIHTDIEKWKIKMMEGIEQPNHDKVRTLDI